MVFFRKVQREGETDLSPDEAMAVLDAYGFPTAKTHHARTRGEAVDAGEKLGYPVALKIISRDISHKVDVGGVKLNLSDRRQVQSGFDDVIHNARTRVPNAGLDGVIVQEYITGGRETIIGFRRDPKFGPLLMFGLGGIYI